MMKDFLLNTKMVIKIIQFLKIQQKRLDKINNNFIFVQKIMNQSFYIKHEEEIKGAF